MQSICVVFNFKRYVLLLYLTYHPFLRLVTLSLQILTHEECHWCILWQMYGSFEHKIAK